MTGALLALAFVMSVAIHVAIVIGLARRKWWRGLVALVVPPLAPWWAWGARMRVRTWAWGVAVLVYAIAVAFAAR
jgi:hypothetical protein